jgi:hypothetical protein
MGGWKLGGDAVKNWLIAALWMVLGGMFDLVIHTEIQLDSIQRRVAALEQKK